MHNKDSLKMTSMKVHRQQGWTIWSLLFVLTVMFGLAYVGMQLVPVYSANGNLKNAMRISLENKDLSKISRTQIIRTMKKQMSLDGASDLIDFKKDLKISRARNKFLMEATYQSEVPLVANLSLVAKFKPKAECQLNGRCDIK